MLIRLVVSTSFHSPCRGTLLGLRKRTGRKRVFSDTPNEKGRTSISRIAGPVGAALQEVRRAHLDLEQRFQADEHADLELHQSVRELRTGSRVLARCPSPGRLKVDPKPGRENAGWLKVDRYDVAPAHTL